MTAVALGGTALHAGGVTSAVLVARPGPLALRQGRVEVERQKLRVVRTRFGVRVASPGLQVDLVEHLFAAIGGLGIGDGLRVDVFGPELPLLDGACAAWCKALRLLGLPKPAAQPSGSALTRVVQPARIRVGTSEYVFAPSDSVRVRVQVAFDHPLVAVQTAAWHGDIRDFCERIATARTFGFRKDLVALRAMGSACAVDPSRVVVLEQPDSERLTASEPGPQPDECARHKLLDLVGDLTLALGSFTGFVRAYRPGHTATHEAVREAARQGVFG